MKKTRLLVVFLILWGIIWMNDGQPTDIQEAIDEGNELCNYYKKENRAMTWILDSMMASINKDSPVYGEMKELKALIQRAGGIISETQELLRGISEKDEKTVNKETRAQKISQFRNNVKWVGAIHQTVPDILRIIFYPLLKEQKEREIIT